MTTTMTEPMSQTPIGAMALELGCVIEGEPLEGFIVGPARDEDAGPEHIAWVSDVVARDHPERIADCKAGILVVPNLWLAIPASRQRAGITIRCDDARTTFARLVNAHFPAPDTRPYMRDDTAIGRNTSIRNASIGQNVKIGANCSIGLPGFGFAANGERFPHHGKVIIGDNVEIGSNTCIDRGALGDTIIYRGAKIDNLVHIAHNCFIGEGARVVAGAVLCGGVTVGARAWIGAGAMVREQLCVGSDAVVGLGAVVVKNVGNGKTVMGNPAR